jgi:hypothetical protein
MALKSRHKTCLVGDFSRYSLAKSYAYAFSQLGIPTCLFDVHQKTPTLSWPVRNRGLHRLTMNSLILRRLFSQKTNDQLLKFILDEKCERVIFFNAEWIMPETIKELKGKGVLTAVFHADNPLPGNYNNRPETMPVAHLVDIYLVWSFRLVELLSEQGINKARFLPFGWDESIMPYNATPRQKLDIGVGFIGGWEPARELILEHISKDIEVSIFGPDYWSKRTKFNSHLRKKWVNSLMVGESFSKTVRSTCINLNILRDQHKFDGTHDGVIMRNFEVPGCGGFLLSTRTETACELFPDEVSGAYFSSAEECVEKIKFYSEHTSYRDRIQLSASRIVRNNYRYTDNVIRLDAIFNEA